MTTTQYLDAVKKSLGLPSDYALAKHLGLTHQAVSKMRRGQMLMGNTTAAKVAEAISADLARVIADVELERGSDEQLWSRIRGAAALVLVSIGAATLGSGPEAWTPVPVGFDNKLFVDTFAMRHNTGRTTDCRQFLARVLAWLRGLL